ncbi:MAG: peptidoglycan bridge formation glycyltransferase FemA/FemB family protein [Acidobacteriota bacterium]|nr:peptidoglycan bridge formation glycyltransferase FemA/FemB family protein [Acidobacteriota bacterium]
MPLRIMAIDIAPSLPTSVSTRPRGEQPYSWLKGASAGQEARSNRMHDVSWQVEVDRSTPAEWSQLLDQFNDANFYQTWSYGGVRWGDRNLSHLVLKQDGEVRGMAQLKIIRPTRLKFGMAYLRWGPLFERRGQPLDPTVAVNLARALQEEYIDRRKLFLRVAPNAFLGSQRAEVIDSAFSKFTPEPPTENNVDRTLVLDLAPSLNELRKRLDKKWRNQLSSSEKKALKVFSGNESDIFRTFCLIYKQMRERKSFETTVDIEEFGRIQADLPEQHRMRVMICADKGMPIAGIVVSAMGDSAIYLLGATGDQGLNSKGAYLLQWTIIKWLKDRGVRWYDLGGIDPTRNPGVFHFKRGLSGAEAYRVIPLVACTNAASSAMVRAGLALQRVIRGSGSSFPPTRFLGRSGTRS